MIRRLSKMVERHADGSWEIANDHLARVEAHEARIARDRPVAVETLSPAPIEQLTIADAATWLDKRLAGDDQTPARDAGFGRDVRRAEAQRRSWLMQQELADLRDDSIQLRADTMAVLRRRELQRVADRLSEELKLAFVESKTGDRIEGTLVRRLDTLGGRFAVVGNSKEFTLVPWRPPLERQLGKPVSGMMREAGVSWTIGRNRGGPGV